jgi:DNA repair exonuclease SbcCD ATPase subunit
LKDEFKLKEESVPVKDEFKLKEESVPVKYVSETRPVQKISQQEKKKISQKKNKDYTNELNKCYEDLDKYKKTYADYEKNKTKLSQKYEEYEKSKKKAILILKESQNGGNLLKKCRAKEKEEFEKLITLNKSTNETLTKLVSQNLNEEELNKQLNQSKKKALNLLNYLKQNYQLVEKISTHPIF